MEENVVFSSPASSMIQESEISTEIIEEGPRICPLCSSGIKPFFINYHEKLIMCENTECEFPFGYEELQFVRYDNGFDGSDIESVHSKSGQSSSLGSDFSSSTWSDIEKLNRFCESAQNQAEPKTLNLPPKRQKSKTKASKREKEKQMQQNLQALKGLALELNDLEKNRTTIKNEKWISNLQHLQDNSGLKLVEPLENKKLIKRVEVKSELKIDIEPGNGGCTSAIKIEIANKNVES